MTCNELPTTSAFLSVATHHTTTTMSGFTLGRKPDVKYGLHIRKKPDSSSTSVPASAASKSGAKPAALSIFGDDSSSDEEDSSVSAQVARMAAAKSKEKHTEKLIKDALEEDPSVFAYDEVVDAMHRDRDQKSETRQQAKKQKAPKYIQLLLEKAKLREREIEIVRERRIHKEIEAEAEVYGDTEEFVTPSYKKHLMERDSWIAEQAKRDANETDVTKQRDLSAFYSNLLSTNEAMGSGTTPTANPSSATSTNQTTTATTTTTTTTATTATTSNSNSSTTEAAKPSINDMKRKRDADDDAPNDAPPSDSTTPTQPDAQAIKKAEIDAARARALERMAKRQKRE
jgi:coiled-coil domain-containing protein 55